MISRCYRGGVNFNAVLSPIFLLSPLQYQNMKNLFYCSFVLIVFASCGHGSASKNTDQVAAPSAPNTLPDLNTTPAQQAPAGTNSSVALNPKHGMPGHRCDIPEGAPLNMTAETAPANPSAPQPLVSPITAPPAMNGGGNVRLNPPHGQPGHDCAVEVGKPLKNG